MKTTLIAGLLTLASTTAAVAAEDRGFYLNASFGQAKYDVSQDELDTVALLAYESNDITVIDANSSLDEKGSAWSLTGGYRFSPYIAVEAGYMNLGSAKYRATGDVFVPGLGVMDSTLGIDIKAKGPVVSAIGVLPLGEKFDVHGHLGVFFSKLTMDIGVSLDDVTVSDSISGSSQDVFAGVGAAYHFTKSVALSLDYSALSKVGNENETGEVDVKSLRLGVQYAF